MNTSEQINEIAAALAKAQGKIKTALKDSTNPHFKSRYADLASIREACADALTSNDIAVVQAHGFDGSNVTLTTRLAHKSGQWMESVYLIKPTKEDPQGYASATTYARRISLSSMVGVVADEDDDGNAASGRQTAPAKPAPASDDNLAKSKSFVDGAITAIGTLTDEAGLVAWLEKNAASLAWIRKSYPDLAKQVEGARDGQRASFKVAG